MQAMKYKIKKRPLGATGMEVSEIGLGTWALGGTGEHEGAQNYGPFPEKDAIDIFGAYVEAGGNHIDSAHNYHDCERRLGIYLKKAGNRDKLIISSKVWQDDEATIRRKLDETRKFLDTDYLDLYYMHNPPDRADDMNRLLDIYCKLKDEGKIRGIGATIKGHNVTDETLRLMHQYIDSGRMDVIMCIYSAIRQKTAEAFAAAEAAGVGIVLRTTLESGFLTGAFKPGHRFTAEQDHRKRWPLDKLDAVLDMVDQFAKDTVKAPYGHVAEVATRFALDTPHVSCVLQGVMKVSELDRNLSVLNLPPLPPETMKLIKTKYSGKEDLVSLGF
jgi:aryl-alcohol dehydrogenase-like predicted oxidoreductase